MLMLRMSASIHYNYFFWPAACSRCLVHHVNGCSEHSLPMPAIHVKLTVLLCRGEWSYRHGWFIVTITIAVRLKHWILQSSSLTIFSGAISMTISNWASFVVNLIVGGELFDCSASVILIWLKCRASHHGRSVICHVSAIQEDTCPSHCDPHTYPDRPCSSDCPMAEDTSFSW
jgi:hypothetical protein